MYPLTQVEVAQLVPKFFITCQSDRLIIAAQLRNHKLGLFLIIL